MCSAVAESVLAESGLDACRRYRRQRQAWAAGPTCGVPCTGVLVSGDREGKRGERCVGPTCFRALSAGLSCEDSLALW